MKYEYKKISFNWTWSNFLKFKLDRSSEEIMKIINKEAESGWRFVQEIKPYSSSVRSYLIFEREVK